MGSDGVSGEMNDGSGNIQVTMPPPSGPSAGESVVRWSVEKIVVVRPI